MDETLSEETKRNAGARLYHPHDQIKDYLEESPPVIADKNATKLPDNELLDLLEFGIPIKWQQQMQVQNFEPTVGTLHNFQNCEYLESALDDPPADNRSNKTPGQEKGNKKRRQNNNNNKDKKNFCMLHGHKPTHS